MHRHARPALRDSRRSARPPACRAGPWSARAWSTRRPFASSRTARKPPMPSSSPRSSNTRAKIRCSRDTPAPVIQCFLPLMTYVSPRLSARVVIASASEPALRLGDADGRLVALEHELRRQLLLRLVAIGHHGRERAHIGLDHDAGGDGAGLSPFPRSPARRRGRSGPGRPAPSAWSCRGSRPRPAP